MALAAVRVPPASRSARNCAGLNRTKPRIQLQRRISWRLAPTRSADPGSAPRWGRGLVSRAPAGSRAAPCDWGRGRACSHGRARARVLRTTICSEVVVSQVRMDDAVEHGDERGAFVQDWPNGPREAW